MTDSYIALDLETTGLESRTDKIIEIAALKVVDGEMKDRLVTLVRPERTLSETVTALTGITDKMLENAPVIEEILPDLLDFCKGFPLLGHNILFDYRFLKQAAVNQKKTFETEAIDTLALSRKFMPACEKKNLGAACGYYCIPQSLVHRAEADAESAHFLYQKLKERYGAENEVLFLPKPLICKVKREQPATKRQKEYLQDLVKCHRIDITVQVNDLSRSEASRLIDGIILQHGKLPKKK